MENTINPRMMLRKNTALILPLVLLAELLSETAQADNFVSVRYATRTDELIVTMAYRGTNPDHTFSLKWGHCKELEGNGRQIVAEVLDNQWQDVEEHDFKTTTRCSLNDLRCRPAKVTLRTAPRFLYTLQIPAKASAQP
jgi:hypothetical protein